MSYKKIFLGITGGVISSLLLSSSAFASPSCPATALRFASSSNILYVSGGASVCTPADLNAAFPTRVIKVSDGVYLTKVNVRISDGATLNVSGPLAGGDTAELRLLSNNNSAATSVVNITADYGNLNFSNTKVISWNESAAGPDTEYANYKRAHIKVRSRVVAGAAQVSQMNIASSDVGYLGYNGAEAYGLAWKVMDGAFSSVDVLGDITDSRIHHNYFGAYMYGAYGMRINNNEFDNNIKYGLDPHDDSDALVITNNRSHHNGNHGIICSQRCDNLTITGNTSSNNIGHGIMLHRSTDFSLVENNTVTNNTDAGIALFESNNNIVRGNYLAGNKQSLRLSVGSSFNRFENNTVASSLGNGIYTYKSSDVPVRGDGINRNNTWTGNIINGSRDKILKLGATNGDNFTNNDFRNNGSAGYDLSGAVNTTFSGNLTTSGKQPGM